LRERKGDIHLLFRKFASDFAMKYKMPTIRLSDEAIQLLVQYRWSGNIRQLRNVAEQISVLETNREVDATTIRNYLPDTGSRLPAVIKSQEKSDFSNEREILYKVLFDMKADLNDLKKLTLELMKNGNTQDVRQENESLINKIYNDDQDDSYETVEEVMDVLQIPQKSQQAPTPPPTEPVIDPYHFAEEIEEEETLSLHDKELELIKKSLERHKGKRKAAAQELGISERTLYRKIKQFDL
ncbi:MAG: sigma-54-dependent Fis family transcriptional regulator, partial [Dokdonia donghaensis]|nr:sigma-54-dependent Fis family transcriptional regulator [Dokdonia donghaensis]